jgi:hypothetical protein
VNETGCQLIQTSCGGAVHNPTHPNICAIARVLEALLAAMRHREPKRRARRCSGNMERCMSDAAAAGGRSGSLCGRQPALGLRGRIYLRSRFLSSPDGNLAPLEGTARFSMQRSGSPAAASAMSAPCWRNQSPLPQRRSAACTGPGLHATIGCTLAVPASGRDACVHSDAVLLIQDQYTWRCVRCDAAIPPTKW